MDRTSVKRVTSAAELKAVAHPLRVQILGSLRLEGPQTASELGRRFGESSGTTSYHLRILEKNGFIEPAPEQPNARDKVWRSAHAYTSWSNRELATDPEGAAAARVMRDRQLANVVASTERFEQEADKWSDEWQDVAGHMDDGVRLTPDSLREARTRFHEILVELAERDADAPGTELVRVYFAAFPVENTEY